jgi:hypothetical protein
MNVALNFRDPVVVQLHAVREQLSQESAGDLAAMGLAATLFAQQNGFCVIAPSVPRLANAAVAIPSAPT